MKRPHEGGMVTLEWLLVIAAVGGFAAVMATAVQQIADNAAEPPARPGVRLIEADIAAAQLSASATASLHEPQSDAHALGKLQQRCEAIADRFDDVVRRATWESLPPTPTAGGTRADGTAPSGIDTPADTTLQESAAGTPTTVTTVAAPAWTCRVEHRASARSAP